MIASAISLGLGALQTGIGIVESIGSKKRIRNLMSKRKAYETPDEIFQILNATENRASQGYDPVTLDYLNNQTDQAFSSSIGASTRLGGDPNDLSAIFNEKVNAIMKIGADNHQLNMKNYSQYIGALDSVAANKAAEQKSREDILKDRLQAEGVNLAAATGNINNGVNTVLGTLAADEIGDLYNEDGSLKTPEQRRRRKRDKGLNYTTTYDTTRIPLMT